MLVGRSAEEKRIEKLLDRARRGRSSAIVLRGEAGIGKTALLEHAADQADDFHVLRAIGVESEAEIAFAGLQQLLRPVVHAFAELPTHQARALGTALALEDGPVPGRIVVSAATLTLLAAAADDRPLLCVVDDAQWLDHASAETLVFAARRLHSEGVVVLFAAREPEKAFFSAAGVEELRVRGLSSTEAKVLLAHSASELAQRTADDIVGLSRGNPLALLELPRFLTDAQRAGRVPLDERVPVSAEIERIFLERASSLSARTRRALLLIASGDPVDAETIWKALEAEALDADPLTEARDAGLVVAERLDFCHPLARSAAYQLARTSERRAAHLALAAVTSEPDRRAWQLAAAAEGPDEQVAVALEAAAAEARRRGGVSAETKALNRAAELTEEPETRARRLLKAAHAAEAAGWLERAEQLLEAVLEHTDDAQLRAQAVARRSYILADRGEFERASSLALTEAERAAPLEAAHVLSGGAIMALFHSLDIHTALATARRAWELAGDDAAADLDLCEMLARAYVLAGRTQDARGLARTGIDTVDPGSILAIDFGTDLLYLEEYRPAREVFERVIARSRDADAPGILHYALDQLAKLETRVANLTRAYALELECFQVTEPLGNDVALAASLAWLGSLEAMLGRSDASTHATRALQIAEPARDEFNIVRARAALGLDALGRGDAAAAVGWLEPAVSKVVDGGVGLPNFFRLDADLVEALTRIGRAEDATAHSSRLAEQARSTEASGRGSRRAAPRAAHVGRRVVAGVRAGARPPRRRPECLRTCPHRALLRREPATDWTAARRSKAASGRTHHVRAPRGAALGGARSRRAPRDRGAHPPTRLERRRAPHAQEFQIATLVAEGLTNRDVAARLFVSSKTVEFHLSGVFRRLGIHTRGELIRLFAVQAPDRVPSTEGKARDRPPGRTAV